MTDNDELIEINPGDISKVENDPEVIVIEDNASSDSEDGSKKKDVDPAAALEKLKRKLKQEKDRANEAESRARAAIAQASSASNEMDDTHLHLVGNAISTIKRDQDILKMNYRDSMASGDYDRVAEIQEAMSTNAAKLLQLENGFNDMKNKPKQVVPPPQQKDFTVEDLITRVTPKSAEWLKEHQDDLGDARSLRIMGRAHDDAVDMGIKAESKEYFKFIEKRLGIGSLSEPVDDDTEVFSEAAKPMQRRQSPPAAPVTRSGNGSGQRPNEIRLTREQVEYAKISGLTPKEYYLEMLREKNRPN